MELGAVVLSAYLVGGIPFSWLAVRLVFGEDVRRYGSGNPGATNASRMWPPRWRMPAFVVLFLLDAGKGFAAVGLIPGLFSGAPRGVPVLAALAAVLGHVFTPYLGFRGGKGVATTLGALAALEPLATGIALAVFFGVFRVTRIVAAGSIAMAAALPLAVALHGTAPREVLVLTTVLGVLIVVRHRSNIARMLRGEET